MLLRHRLALTIAVTLVLSLAASVVIADILYGQIQFRQSAALMERELGRVQAVVRSGALGEEILPTDRDALWLQFVTTAERVALPTPGGDPLPLHGAPTVVAVEGGARLVASVPWVLPSGFEVGTIRLALDLREVEASRAALRAGMVTSGALILMLALLGALISLRHSLAPLLGLATEAARVDPAEPRLAVYRGPHDEVGLVADGLNRALDGIRERSRAERDALAEVAHELAGPLTVVAGQLRALEAAHAADGRIAAARAAADELLHTSQDLLTLARGELESVHDLRVVDLAEVAGQIAAEYPGVGLVHLGGDTRVLASSERARQVVRNLVRNAVQAAGRPEGVLVRTSAEGDTATLEVVDDGPGMPPEMQELVFERYVSQPHGAGAGVGLSVAKRIVEAFDGTIRVRSRPGEGSTFTATFPRLEARLVSGAAEVDGSA